MGEHMSRIGKLPIKIPSNVDIICNDLNITVTGKFGTLYNKIPNILGIEQKDGTLIVVLKSKTRNGSALHGLHRTLINNMIIGVSEQFDLRLILTGVGSRATSKSSLVCPAEIQNLALDIKIGVAGNPTTQ